jgi:hypothetical protein
MAEEWLKRQAVLGGAEAEAGRNGPLLEHTLAERMTP